MQKTAAWLLALMPAAMLLVLMVRPVWDVDVFWQLKLGELTLRNGGPIGKEPFAVSHLGEMLPAVAWLGQAIMAKVRLVAGWTGLRLFDGLCWLGGFWAAAWAARRTGATRAGLVLALAYGLAAALPTASIRPQSFSALCFGLLIANRASGGSSRRRLAVAAVLLVLWQNLHPSVAVAAVWAGALAASGWILLALRRTAIAPWEDSLLALLAAAATFATPDGFGILAISAANAADSQAMGVSEWLPLWAPVNHRIALPLAMMAIAGIAMLARSRRIDWREATPALVLFLLTLFAYRFVLFWAIAMVPVIARVALVPDANAPRRIMPLAMLVAIAAVLVWLPTRFYSAIPLEPIARLRSSGVTGTVFAHFPWGGPAIDAGYPDWRVAYDGRYYRYTPEEWALYDRIAREPGGLAEAEARYRPAAFVLDPEWDAPLIGELRAATGAWREVQEPDKTTAIFVRVTR